MAKQVAYEKDTKARKGPKRNPNTGMHPGEKLSTLKISIKTGTDDLRSSSSVTAYVILSRLAQVEELDSFSLNNSQKWDNGTTNVVNFNVNSKLFETATIGDIKRFGLKFTSGQDEPLQTGDNWNMNDIVVTYPVAGAPGQDDTLLEAHSRENSNPVHRFVSDRDEWHIDLK